MRQRAMMTNNISVAEAAEWLLSHDNIVLLCHEHPDGDTLGSAYAIKAAFPEKNIRLVCSDNAGRRLSFICGDEDDLSLERGDGFAPDCVVSIDIADLSLIGGYAVVFGDRVDLKIDHHMTSVAFAEKNLIDPNAAACGEIIYKILEVCGRLNPSSASALYAAIASDTGCFKFRNVSSQTHTIAASLISAGADYAEINNRLFESKSQTEIAVLKYALNNMSYHYNGFAASITITNEAKKTVGMTDESLSSINGLPREIEGVEVGIVLRQVTGDDRKYKISMRSGSVVNVSSICAVFGGGGHIRASGATICADSPQEALKIVMSELEKYLKENDIRV